MSKHASRDLETPERFERGYAPTTNCPVCGTPIDGLDADARTTVEPCGHSAAGLTTQTMQRDTTSDANRLMTDGGLEQTAVVDEFVVDHAVCREDAETFVHLGLDDHFHPTGGFWFPSDIDPDDDRSGWVHCEDAVPYGNLIQYPRDDRPPRMVGHEELPDWVKDRVVEVATDGGTEQVRAVFTAYEDEADLETNDAGTITNHEELVNDGQTYREIRFLSPDTVDAFDLTTVDESHTHWCDEVAAMEPGDRLRVDELRGNDDAE